MKCNCQSETMNLNRLRVQLKSSLVNKEILYSITLVALKLNDITRFLVLNDSPVTRELPDLL